MNTSAVRLLVLCASLAALTVQGCEDSMEAPPPCLLVVFPAIEVRVFDAPTHELISGFAHGLLTNGQHTDSLRACLVDGQGRVETLCGAHGFSGTFYVSLSAPGYVPWDSTGVVVPSDRCGNLTTYLEVALWPVRVEAPQDVIPGVNGLPNSVLQPAAPRLSMQSLGERRAR